MKKIPYQFKPMEQKRDQLLENYRRGERLSKSDFGVMQGWKKLEPWLERWLINHHKDWFDAIESMSQMLAVGEYEK